MMMCTVRPYEEGKAARDNNQLMLTNPYSFERERDFYDAWKRGWKVQDLWYALATVVNIAQPVTPNDREALLILQEAMWQRAL
jgi:hypothetical protein